MIKKYLKQIFQKTGYNPPPNNKWHPSHITYLPPKVRREKELIEEIQKLRQEIHDGFKELFERIGWFR